MNTVFLTFTLEKETKNTMRYTEQPVKGSPAIVGTLYIQKWALPQPAPTTITVTIEASE